MKYEDLKCEFCDGHGENERFVEPYSDSPVTCSFCNGTGVDEQQLIEFLALNRFEPRSSLFNQIAKIAKP